MIMSSGGLCSSEMGIQGTVVHRLALRPKSGKLTDLNRLKITDTCTAEGGGAGSEHADGW
jgi:hypothetical protein